MNGRYANSPEPHVSRETCAASPCRHATPLLPRTPRVATACVVRARPIIFLPVHIIGRQKRLIFHAGSYPSTEMLDTGWKVRVRHRHLSGQAIARHDTARTAARHDGRAQRTERTLHTRPNQSSSTTTWRTEIQCLRCAICCAAAAMVRAPRNCQGIVFPAAVARTISQGRP